MSQKDIDDLTKLVYSNRGTEVKCGKYLTFVKGCMVKNVQGQMFEHIHNSTEFPMHRGRADFIVSAKIKQSGGESYNIFLWELKSSKCHIFEFDNDHRLRPSKFLYDAEHKLINFYKSFRADDDCRIRFSPPGLVISHDDVKMGGIIIGKNDNRILDGMDVEEINRQYNIAIETRNIFYQDRITIYTWDDIIEEFKRVNVIGKNIESENIIELTLPPGIQYLKVKH